MSNGKKQKLTKTLIKALAPKNSAYIVWDTDLFGFGCRIYPSGRKAYIVQYYSDSGEQKRPVIGVADVLLISEAREKARQILLQLTNGINPFDEREAEKKTPTMSEFAERYMNEHAIPKKKPSSVRTDELNLRLHIIPAMGRIKIHKIDRQDVQRLHSQMVGTPGAANRTLALLSKIMNLAEKWGERPDGTNPCRHVEKYKEKKLGRFINPSELARLGEVLRQVEAEAEEMRDKDSEVRIRIVHAIRLLLLTGCRLSEMLSMKWDYIDFSLRVAFLPDSKTGQKTVYFSDAAVSVIRSVKRVDGNPYVFAGRFGRGYLHRMSHLWLDVRRRAGVADLRLHDLRHGYASAGVGMGESLSLVGQLLGHTQTQTTARYAHLAMSPLLSSTDRIGERIVESLGISRAQETHSAPLTVVRWTDSDQCMNAGNEQVGQGYTLTTNINFNWDVEKKKLG